MYVCVCVWMPVNQVWLYFVPQNTVSNCGKKHTFFFFFFVIEVNLGMERPVSGEEINWLSFILSGML